MGFKCGIVGLPNVGKSTLFNALTETAAAQAANYPFCTIEPNVGEVAVPDPRLDKLAAIAKSAQIIPTRLTFVDIAGLVRGASKGEGLGNQFLANIREVDAIAHVVRCFEDSDITHVEGKIAPLADIETIETELMLADLDSLEKRVDNLTKKAKGNDKDAKEQLDLVNRTLVLLRDGKPARLVERKAEEERAFGMLGLVLHCLRERIARGGRAFLDVADIEHRLGGQQRQAPEWLALVGRQIHGAGRPALAQHRQRPLHQVDLGLGVLVAALGPLGRGQHPPLQPLHVGQHQLGVDDLGIAHRVDRAFDMGDLALEAAQHVQHGVGLADIGQELVAQPLALRRAAHQPGDVDEL